MAKTKNNGGFIHISREKTMDENIRDRSSPFEKQKKIIAKLPANLKAWEILSEDPARRFLELILIDARKNFNPKDKYVVEKHVKLHGHVKNLMIQMGKGDISAAVLSSIHIGIIHQTLLYARQKNVIDRGFKNAHATKEGGKKRSRKFKEKRENLQVLLDKVFSDHPDWSLTKARKFISIPKVRPYISVRRYTVDTRPNEK